MRLPIDTSGMGFIAASAAKPKTVFGTGEVQMDKESGKAWYVVDVLMSDGAGGSAQLRLKVAGPLETQFGDLLKVTGLWAMPWENEGRNGIAYTATRIERAQAPAPAKAG